MNVFEEMRQGKAYDIYNEDYQQQVHSEIGRCSHLCSRSTSAIPGTGKLYSVKRRSFWMDGWKKAPI